LMVEEVSVRDIPRDVESVVSHESTAQVLTSLLNREVKFNRVNVSLRKGDTLYVFQVLQRPREGQVFTTDELQQIINEKKYKDILCETCRENKES